MRGAGHRTQSHAQTDQVCDTPWSVPAWLALAPATYCPVYVQPGQQLDAEARSKLLALRLISEVLERGAAHGTVILVG